MFDINTETTIEGKEDIKDAANGKKQKQSYRNLAVLL